MNKLTTGLLGLALLAAPVVMVLGQVTIEPPPTPATSAATAPATNSAPAATLPSAENVLEGLLHAQPAVTSVLVRPSTAPAIPSVEAAAPTEPKAKLRPERDTIELRMGRLVKDEKSGNWIFAFDADGKGMQDPPLAIIPSQFLEAMEKLSDNGTKPVKFRISGELTQYKGHNFLLIRAAQIVQDLNQGLGG